MWFRRTPEKPKAPKFDKVSDQFFDDPKLIWDAQISGEKNFESCSFMGALNDLHNVPDWRSVFDPIKNEQGVKVFLDRLQAHFDLCKPSVQEDGRQYLYMHPSRTKQNISHDPETLIELANRFIATTTKAYELSGHLNEAEVLRGYEAEYLSATETISLDPPGLYLSEAWDFESYSENAPNIVGCLYEATYSLANDFALTRYLMQSFRDHNLDVEAEYNLIWKHHAKVCFVENMCYVTAIH